MHSNSKEAVNIISFTILTSSTVSTFNYCSLKYQNMSPNEKMSEWISLPLSGGSFLVSGAVKYLPAMQKTTAWFLGLEDPLEKRMATHSSILAWRIPWTEQPGGIQSIWSQRIRHNWATKHAPSGVSLCSIFQRLNLKIKYYIQILRG